MANKFYEHCEGCESGVDSDEEFDWCEGCVSQLGHKPSNYRISSVPVKGTICHDHDFVSHIHKSHKEFVAYKVKPVKVEVNTVDKDVIIHDYLEMLSQIMKVAKELGIKTEPDVYVSVETHRKNKFN